MYYSLAYSRTLKNLQARACRNQDGFIFRQENDIKLKKILGKEADLAAMHNVFYKMTLKSITRNNTLETKSIK